MIRAVGIVVFSLALWLLLSGLFKPLLIGFGVATSFGILFLLNWMNRVDGWPLVMEIKPIAFLSYFAWLNWQIAISVIVVTKTILSPRLNLKQQLFSVRTTQRTDLGQFIFANSITLTPGTISVEVEPGHFVIHALSYDESDKDALADMCRRVSKTEWGG